MTAPTVMFFLMLISQGGGSFSLTQIGSYDSKAACTGVQQAVKQSLGSAQGTRLACISVASLEALEDANK